MRAVIYSRVSTEGQEKEGTSLDTQESAGLKYAASAGWSVVDTVRDSSSGYDLRRPGLEKVRALITSGACDVVLSYAVDRLSRNQNHIGILFEEALSHRVKLEFVTEKFEDNPTGRFILAARAFVAEIEREKIAERTARGKGQRAASGRIPQATGRGVYGYWYDRATGKRVINPEQAAVVNRIFDEFLSGYSISRIAVRLNNDGIPAMAGGPWYPLTVRRVLTNECLTGRTTFRRTRIEHVIDPSSGKRMRVTSYRDDSEWIDVPNATPQIIDLDRFRRVQQALEDPARKLRGRQPSTRYLLRGRLRCRRCGAAMVGQALGKGRYHYYRCCRTYSSSPAGSCTTKYIRQDLLEPAIINGIVALLTDPAQVEAALLRHYGIGSATSRRHELEKQLSQVLNRQKRLTKLYLQGDMPEDVLDDERRTLNAQRQQLEQQLAAEPAEPALNASEIRDLSPRLTEDLAQILRDLAAEGRFEVVLAGLAAEVRTDNELAHVKLTLGSPELLKSIDNRRYCTTIEQTSA